MKNIVIVVCILITAAAVSVSAVTVRITLIDDSELQGEVVKKTGGSLTLKTVAGLRTITISDIKKIEKIRTTEDIYREKAAAIDSDSAQDHIELADWCRENGLITRYYHHLNETLRTDPDNEKAHTALGHVRYERSWVEDGVTKKETLWVKPEERDRLMEEERKAAEKLREPGTASPRNGVFMTAERNRDLTVPPADLKSWQRDFFMKYIPDLGSNDWRKREIAIKTLISQDFSDRVPPLLLEITVTGSAPARADALDALARMKYEGAQPFFEDRALNDPSDQVRIKAMFGLGELGMSASVPVLLKTLDHENMDVVREAVAALEKITFVTYDFLSTIDVEDCRSVYRKWYEQNAGRDRREILINVAATGPPMDRLRASRILFEQGYFDAVGHMIDLLAGDDMQAKVEANAVLVELTGQDFGFDPYTTSDMIRERSIEQWREWYSREREVKKPDGKKDLGISMSSENLFEAMLRGGSAKEKAAAAVTAMEKTRSIPLLLAVLNHEDFFVRAACFSLFNSITEYTDSFGYDPKEENEAVRLTYIAKLKEWFHSTYSGD
jgi:hypothetical protein